jgi:hypothetical protein
MQTLLKKTVVATLLAFSAGPLLASNYFVVVPVPNRTATAAKDITVALTGLSLPSGLIGTPYVGFDFKSLLNVTGDPAYNGFGVKWNVVAGSLPSGLTLNSNGTLSGTPMAAGTSSFQVMASYKSKAGQQAYQVQVANITVGLAAGAPPQALVGQAYSYDLKPLLSVSGDNAYTGAGVTWTVVSSSLPAGLYLTSDGFIGGTPTAGGTGSITARASYKGVNGQQSYQVVSLAVSVTLAAGTPPQALVGQAYSYSLNSLLSVNGDSAFTGSGVTWSVVSSTLPAGLYLTNDGWIGGTPTANGSGTITARATYRGVNGQQSYQVVTLATPAYATWDAAKSPNAQLSNGNLSVNLPNAVFGQAISATAKSSGKWYWEISFDTFNAPLLGVAPSPPGNWNTSSSPIRALYMTSDNFSFCGAAPVKNVISVTKTVSAVIGVALDMDAHKLSLYQNGKLLGVLCSNLSGSVAPFVSTGVSDKMTANFGQKPFRYTVPAGFNAGLSQ